MQFLFQKKTTALLRGNVNANSVYESGARLCNFSSHFGEMSKRLVAMCGKKKFIQLYFEVFANEIEPFCGDFFGAILNLSTAAFI